MKNIVLFLIAFLCCTMSPVLAGSINLIDIHQLKAQLGSHDVVILDVRAGRDWSTSEFKIPGAIRANGEDFEQWSTNLPKDKNIVLYCA